jgi:GDP-fucose transporter C1
MSNEGISVPAPLFVTWYQCVITCLICWCCGLCGQRAQAADAENAKYTAVPVNEGAAVAAPKPSFFAQFPKAEYLLGPARQIFPLSIVFVGMITFNNLCLKFVEVSFYNVARSLTIVFNVVLSRLFLGIPTSFKTTLCLGVVIVGFLMGSRGELNFSLIGTVSGVLSSLFVSLNSIFTKKVLPVVDDNHWKLTFYNNVNASILFVPLVLIFEYDILKEATQQLTSQEFWVAMTVAGFFGFSIGIVTVLQIKATSPLSHNISGTAKAAVQSLMAFYIWGNEPTVMGVLGIFTTLGGSLLYTFVKMGENASAAPAPVMQQQGEKEQEMSKV